TFSYSSYHHHHDLHSFPNDALPIWTTAIQICKIFGAIVYCTVGSEEKRKIALDLGADKVINYKTEDFVDILKPVGVDLVLDSIRSEEHTSELQSRENLVCRLLLEKK